MVLFSFFVEFNIKSSNNNNKYYFSLSHAIADARTDDNKICILFNEMY